MSNYQSQNIYHLNTSQNQNDSYIIPNNIINDSFDAEVDSLFLTHFLRTYDINSISDLNPSSIQSPLERRLYDLIVEQYTNITLQPPPSTEPTVEYMSILPTDNICSDCDICYEYFETVDKVELNCGHQMCKSCISECLKKNKTCPFCRIVITKIVHKQI